MSLSAYIVGRQERCGNCMCMSSALYYAGECQEEADDIRADWGGGLCRECLADWAEAEGVVVIWPGAETGRPASSFAIPEDVRTVIAILELFE